MGQKLTDDELLHLSPEEREFYESVSEEDDSVDEDEEPDYDENDYLDPEDRTSEEESDDGDADESADSDADGADADDGADNTDGNDEGEEGEDNGADDEPGEGKDAKDAEGEGEDEPGDGDGSDGEDEGYKQPGPALDYELPSDWKERMDSVQTQLTELEAEWDDGELEADAYKEKRAALRNDEKELDRQYTKAEIAADFRQQQAQNQWADDVQSFFKEYPQFKPNGETPDDNDNPFYDALDAHVVKIAKASPELTGKQVLKKALERFPENMRKSASEEAEGGKDEGKGKGKGKAMQRREVPPTLRNVPASTVTETDSGGKFAHLDKLDGVALEKAMARMSDAERDAYMRT